MVDKTRYRQLLAMALLVLAASGQRGRRRTPDAFRRAIRTILLIETALAWEGAVSRTGNTQPPGHRPLRRSASGNPGASLCAASDIALSITGESASSVPIATADRRAGSGRSAIRIV